MGSILNEAGDLSPTIINGVAIICVSGVKYFKTFSYSPTALSNPPASFNSFEAQIKTPMPDPMSVSFSR
jgi:hypothetical protein